MKFSTRTTYGLRAMIELAKNEKRGSTSLSFISEKEKISLGYLERLFSKLKKAGLVKSEKGASGGYKLASKPAEIIIFDIVKTLEGDITPFRCLGEDGKIKCSTNCGATSMLIKVQDAISKTLKSIKLSDLL